MKTIEIVIDEVEQAGGLGVNFIFDWKKAPTTKELLFECIMISTYGAQDPSFRTQGKRMEEQVNRIFPLTFTKVLIFK